MMGMMQQIYIALNLFWTYIAQSIRMLKISVKGTKMLMNTIAVAATPEVGVAPVMSGHSSPT